MLTGWVSKNKNYSPENLLIWSESYFDIDVSFEILSQKNIPFSGEYRIKMLKATNLALWISNINILAT